MVAAGRIAVWGWVGGAVRGVKRGVCALSLVGVGVVSGGAGKRASLRSGDRTGSKRRASKRVG